MDAIEKAIEILDKRREGLKSFRPLYETAKTALKLADIEGHFDLHTDSILWCHIWPENKAEIVKALRALAKFGIRNSRGSKPYINTGCLAYHLADRDHKPLHFFCDLSKSETCNLVKTGVKEEPVYEVVCT